MRERKLVFLGNLAVGDPGEPTGAVLTAAIERANLKREQARVRESGKLREIFPLEPVEDKP